MLHPLATHPEPFMTLAFLVAALAIAALSLLADRRPATVDGFFGGRDRGAPPGLWTLVLSQVTTWIFARSLMDAAILGYYYGFPGTDRKSTRLNSSDNA